MASRGPGLASRGNRILLSIGLGWLVWLFAGGLEITGGARVVAGVVAGAIAYGLVGVLAAQRSDRDGQDGSDSSR